MTPESRIYRLERVFKFAVMAGRRWRSKLRELDEKVDITIDAQIKHEEDLASLKAENDAVFVKLDSMQRAINRRVDELTKFIGKDRE